MAKFIVNSRAVFIDHESGLVKDRRKDVGQTFTAKASEVSHLVEAGLITEIRKPTPKATDE